MIRFSVRVLAVLGSFMLASLAAAAGDAEAGAARAATCAACHGLDGNSINPQWPSLAGQGEAYMVTQLHRFKSGERADAVMSPQAALLSEQDILDVAAYYAVQTPKIGVAQAGQKVLDRGQLIYRGGILERQVPACITCHGPSGAGNGPAEFPRLSGQHAVYVALQLKTFRENYEPHKSHARQNPMMSAIAAKLTDEEIEAVAQYVSGLH